MHKPVLAAFSRCLSNNGVGRFADLVDVRLSGMNGFRIVSLEVCRCSSNGGDRSGHPDHGIQVGEIEFLWVKFVETLRQVILGFDNLLSGGRVSKMVAFVKTDAPNIHRCLCGDISSTVCRVNGAQYDFGRPTT